MKRFAAVFLAIALALAVPSVALALEVSKEAKVDYQAIIDKLNKEYGTGIRFATNAEMEAAGVAATKASQSV